MRVFGATSLRNPLQRSAFTLVEMLVSVALVMLMMTSAPRSIRSLAAFWSAHGSSNDATFHTVTRSGPAVVGVWPAR